MGVCEHGSRDGKGCMDAVTRISGSTRLVGLIGSPVTYSGSPAHAGDWGVFDRFVLAPDGG